MYPQTKRNALLAFMLMAAFVLACSGLGNETEKANQLVDEGNKMVEEGNKLGEEAQTKFQEISDKIADFPDNREELRKPSEELTEIINKGSGKFHDASKKFDEASKLKLDDKFKEYLSLKSQEFNKHAEHIEALKGIPQAILDPAIKDGPALNRKLTSVNASVEKVGKEWKDLEAKANKVREDNKDKFKQ
jgi:peptidoglycan hydrolase CwlO-like protein